MEADHRKYRAPTSRSAPSLAICEEGEVPKEKRKGKPELTIGELPGIPIALVCAGPSAAELAGKFLCAVDAKNGEHGPKESKAAAEALKAHVKQTKKVTKFGGKGDVIEDFPGVEDFDPTAEDLVSSGRKRKRAPPIKKRPSFYPYHDDEFDDSDEDDDTEWDLSAATPAAVRTGPCMGKSLEGVEGGAHFEQLPLIHPDDPSSEKSKYRTVSYVAANAGAGKTVFTTALAKKYHFIWPDRPIWGVCMTPMKNDPAWAGIPIHQLPVETFKNLGGETVEEKKESTLESLFGNTGCLLILDDWDSFEGEKKKWMRTLIKQAIDLGRKMLISIIVTSHQISNYHETRDIITASEFVTLFPQHGMPHHLRYICKKLGLSQTQTDRLFDMGRWVTIHTIAPRFILSEKKCELITHLS